MKGDLRTVGACSHRNKSDNSDTVDGLKPIRTVGVYSHRNEPDNSTMADRLKPSVRRGLAPTAIREQSKNSGWTKAHPYSGGLTPAANARMYDL